MYKLRTISLRVREVLIWTFVMLCVINHAIAQTEVGIPFTRNFIPAEYGAHTQNFDVIEDKRGNVYVANFAGLLQFNGEDWKLITTPDISRVTSLGLSAEGTVFLGGLNELGFLEVTSNGVLAYKDLTSLIDSDTDRNFGEVEQIFVHNRTVYFFSHNHLFSYEKNQLKTVSIREGLKSVFKLGEKFLWQSDAGDYHLLDPVTNQSQPFPQLPGIFEVTAVIPNKSGHLLATGTNGLMRLEGGTVVPLETEQTRLRSSARITSLLRLPNGDLAVGTQLNGIYFIDESGKEVTRSDRAFGLQNDYVTSLFLDSKNRVWAALNNGISLLNYPWPWTRYDISNGLKAGVVSMKRFEQKLFVGTYQGLYVLNEVTKRFDLFGNLDFATWDLELIDDHLYAATSEGVFAIQKGGVSKITEDFTLSLTSTPVDPDHLYTGTLTGFQKVNFNTRGSKSLIEDNDQVTDLITDQRGNIWLTTLTGKIARYQVGQEQVTFMGAGQDVNEISGSRAFNFDDKLIVSTRNGVLSYNEEKGGFDPLLLSSDTTNRVATWPGLLSEGKGGRVWMTAGDETQITLFEKEGSNWQPKPVAFAPFANFVCRTILTEGDGTIWFGGPSGIVRMNQQLLDGLMTDTEVRISEITVGSDSTYFAGNQSETYELVQNPSWGYTYRSMRFAATSDGFETENPVQYNYRLQGYDNDWTGWQNDHQKLYSNLSPGSYTLLVKARSAYGTDSPETSFSFEILNPWYLKWYVVMLYVLILLAILWQISRWRLRRLVREKEILEVTVKQRTAEISSQRDEIQKQSEELSEALVNLEETQGELIRQEKLASVGQLTKGIVDRVINPLNYINNFSELSIELNEELKELLDDEKEKITEDVYDELNEINGMLSDNLTKINAHGGSTTRMIKAMEEILKDRGGKRAEINLNQLVLQSVNLITHAYKEVLEQKNIALISDLEGDDLIIEGAPEELSKSIHQLIDNAVQAVVSRCEKEKLDDMQVVVSAAKDGKTVVIRVKDTGVGIPDKEVNQIFDPFFTTKTTAQGAGVGLYLVKEIVLSHKGEIQVASEVNKGTTFEISLPLA